MLWKLIRATIVGVLGAFFMAALGLNLFELMWWILFIPYAIIANHLGDKLFTKYNYSNYKKKKEKSSITTKVE